MNHLQTPLSRVKGLGSAKEGTEHFWSLRITALAMIPLVLWFCFSIASLPQANYETMLTWLRNPVNAILSAIVLVVSLYHAQLGLQVIIEDYVSDHGAKLISIIGVKFVNFFFGVVGLYSIIKTSIGG